MKAAVEAAPQNLLSPRTTTQVGTWNVRTMCETGKTTQIVTDTRQNKLAVLGLCETRLSRSGQICLATGETLVHSEHEEEDAAYTEGVVLMLSKGAAGALLDWMAFSSRIITAKFDTRICKVLIVHTMRGPRSKKGKLVVTGDFNASNIGKELVMRKEGLGEITEKGEWISPDHQTENQIDNICTSSTFRRPIQDVCSKRGADVGTDLVTGKIKFKFNRYVQPT